MRRNTLPCPEPSAAVHVCPLTWTPPVAGERFLWQQRMQQNQSKGDSKGDVCVSVCVCVLWSDVCMCGVVRMCAHMCVCTCVPVTGLSQPYSLLHDLQRGCNRLLSPIDLVHIADDLSQLLWWCLLFCPCCSCNFVCHRLKI